MINNMTTQPKIAPVTRDERNERNARGGAKGKRPRKTKEQREEARKKKLEQLRLARQSLARQRAAQRQREQERFIQHIRNVLADVTDELVDEAIALINSGHDYMDVIAATRIKARQAEQIIIDTANKKIDEDNIDIPYVDEDTINDVVDDIADDYEETIESEQSVYLGPGVQILTEEEIRDLSPDVTNKYPEALEYLYDIPKSNEELEERSKLIIERFKNYSDDAVNDMLIALENLYVIEHQAHERAQAEHIEDIITTYKNSKGDIVTLSRRGESIKRTIDEDASNLTREDKEDLDMTLIHKYTSNGNKEFIYETNARSIADLWVLANRFIDSYPHDKRININTQFKYVNSNGDIRYVNIKEINLIELDKFEDIMSHAMAGSAGGSDPELAEPNEDDIISGENRRTHYIDYSVLVFRLFSHEQHYSKVDKDYFMFAVQDDASKKKTSDQLCIWQSVFGEHSNSPLAGKYDESKPISGTITDAIEFNKQLMDQYGYGITLYHDYPKGGIPDRGLERIEFAYEPQSIEDEPRANRIMDNSLFKPFEQEQQRVPQKFTADQVFNPAMRDTSKDMRANYIATPLNERYNYHYKKPLGERGYPTLKGDNENKSLEPNRWFKELYKYPQALIIRDETSDECKRDAFKGFCHPQHFANVYKDYLDPVASVDKKHFIHEVVHSNRKQKVKFDLDGSDASSKDRIVEALQQMLFIKYEGLMIDTQRDIIYLNASNETKCSWHLILPTLLVANSLEMKNLRDDLINYIRDLARDTSESDIAAIDSTCSDRQNFRMPLSWKINKKTGEKERPFKFDNRCSEYWRFEDALVTYICPNTPSYILPRCVSDSVGKLIVRANTKSGPGTVQLGTDGVDKYFTSVIQPEVTKYFGVGSYHHTRTDNYGLHMVPSSAMRAPCYLCNRRHENDGIYFKLRESNGERSITYHCWRANGDATKKKSHTIWREKMISDPASCSQVLSQDSEEKKEEQPAHVYYRFPVIELACDKFNTLPEDKQVRIVYYNRHVEPYRGIVDARFYIDDKNNVLRLGKKNSDLKRKIIKNKMSKRMNEGKELKYTKVTYDLETITNPITKQLEPYSISYSTTPTDIYFRLAEPTSQRSITKNFIQHLLDEEEGKKYTLNGYNSSRFDNLFILPDILDLGVLEGSPFYQSSGSMLNIKWGYGGKHTVFDVCRFTTLSLEKTCEAMKTSMQKVAGGISHVDIQREYARTGRIMWCFHDDDCENTSDELLHFKLSSTTDQAIVTSEIEAALKCDCKKYHDLVVYNVFDVLSCAEIYDRVEKCMHDTGAIPHNVELADCKTIGSAMYKKFQRDMKELDGDACNESQEWFMKTLTPSGKRIKEPSKRFKLPKIPTLDEYNLIRSSLFAGRTQCFNGPEAKDSNDEPEGFRMIDVISEYPAMMTQRDYPCGDIRYDIPYSYCKRAGRIGFYDCVINQTKLREANKPNLIPLRKEDSSLDWFYTGDIALKRLNTIDLAELEKRGCVKSVGDGICFTGKIAGKDLFKCIYDFKKVKQEQDALGAGHPRYNAAMRQMAKLCMNCLSGKVIENLHTDRTELVRSQAEMDMITATKAARVRGHNGEVQGYKIVPTAVFDRKAALVTYEIEQEKCFKKARPIYLGICIYAYARSHLYNEVLEHYNPIYCDTDSALMKKSDFDRFERERPQMCAWLNVKGVAGEFGQFEQEKGSESMAGYVCIAPKNYFIYDRDGKRIKKGFKGINLARDKYVANPLDYPDVFIKSKHGKIDKKTRKRYDVYDVKSQKAAFNLYNSNKLPLLDDIEYKGVDGKLYTMKGASKKFCDEVREKGSAYVLCGSLHRATTVSSDDKIQAGGIYQQWCLKRITACFKETDYLRER